MANSIEFMQGEILELDYVSSLLDSAEELSGIDKMDVLSFIKVLKSIVNNRKDVVTMNINSAFDNMEDLNGGG